MGIHPIRLALLLSLLFAAATAFARIESEIHAVVISNSAPRLQLENLQSQTKPRALPWSVRGRAGLLNACMRGQVQGALALYPSAWQDQLYHRCGDYAATIQQQWPTYSLAHYVRLQSRIGRGEPLDLPTEIEKTRRLAPSESWLAGWRLLMAMNAGTPALFGDDGGMQNDIVILAQASFHFDTLLRLYNAYPEWREVVISGVLQAPEVDQRNFLTAVKASRQAVLVVEQ